jgi:preprotein translocase subunit SecF
MIFCGTVLSLWISVAEAQDITGLADEALIMTGTFQQLCKTNHFSAQVQVETHLPAIEKTNTVQISQSDTNLRMQLKISEIAASSAQMRTALEKLGVDDVTVIVNEEKLQTYIVFPQLKCFIENPASTQTMDLIKSSHEVNFRRTVLSIGVS